MTLTGLGTCTITATQPGNAIYAAAMPVPQAFMVTQGSQTIVMTVLAEPGVPERAHSRKRDLIFGSAGDSCFHYPFRLRVIRLRPDSARARDLHRYRDSAGQPELCRRTHRDPDLHDRAGEPDHRVRGPREPTAGNGSVSGERDRVVRATCCLHVHNGGGVYGNRNHGCPSDRGNLHHPGGSGGERVFVAAIPVQQTFTVGPAMNIAAVLNAASYAQLPLAAGAYTVAFGSELAIGTAQTPSVMLPSTLAGTTVTITDSTGATLTAPLYYVSPSQINFLVPSGLASGAATVTVANPNVGNGSFPVTVAPVAPALFTADASGHGVPAAIAFDSTAAGQTEAPPVFSCSGSPVACVAEPIELGAPSTQVFLVLFGTGIRGRSRLAGVSVTAGGVPLTVEYAGAQGTYPRP